MTLAGPVKLNVGVTCAAPSETQAETQPQQLKGQIEVRPSLEGLLRVESSAGKGGWPMSFMETYRRFATGPSSAETCAPSPSGRGTVRGQLRQEGTSQGRPPCARERSSRPSRVLPSRPSVPKARNAGGGGCQPTLLALVGRVLSEKSGREGEDGRRETYDHQRTETA